MCQAPCSWEQQHKSIQMEESIASGCTHLTRTGVLDLIHPAPQMELIEAVSTPSVPRGAETHRPVSLQRY